MNNTSTCKPILPITPQLVRTIAKDYKLSLGKAKSLLYRLYSGQPYMSPDNSFADLSAQLSATMTDSAPDRFALAKSDTKSVDTLYEHKNVSAEAAAILELLGKTPDVKVMADFDILIPTGKISDNVRNIVKRYRLSQFTQTNYNKVLNKYAPNFPKVKGSVKPQVELNKQIIQRGLVYQSEKQYSKELKDKERIQKQTLRLERQKVDHQVKRSMQSSQASILAKRDYQIKYKEYKDSVKQFDERVANIDLLYRKGQLSLEQHRTEWERIPKPLDPPTVDTSTISDTRSNKKSR